jgi:ferredoxin-thioredoxin reductase catalytic chain
MEAEKLRELMKKYAESQGFKLNPDEKVVNSVIKGLLGNEFRHGYRYCLCRVLTGDRPKDAKLICPCVYRKDEIRGMGLQVFNPPALHIKAIHSKVCYEFMCNDGLCV